MWIDPLKLAGLLLDFVLFRMGMGLLVLVEAITFLFINLLAGTGIIDAHCPEPHPPLLPGPSLVCTL